MRTRPRPRYLTPRPWPTTRRGLLDRLAAGVAASPVIAARLADWQQRIGVRSRVLAMIERHREAVRRQRGEG